MNTTEDDQKRKEFKALLLELAKEEAATSPQNRVRLYRAIEELYAPNSERPFRHYYSDIFQVIIQIKRDGGLGDVEYLGLNLSQLRDGYQAIRKDTAGNPIDAGPYIQKLYDHVSLDIARLAYMDGADNRVSEIDEIKSLSDHVTQLSGQVQSAKRDMLEMATLKEQVDRLGGRVHNIAPQVEKLQADIDEAKTLKEQVGKLEGSLGNAQKEYVAILGIFAAIVVTFISGLAFSTSVLQNIHLASIYRILLVTLVIGLVLFNVLYALFYYIDQLVHDQVKKELRMFAAVNTILIALILLVVCCWQVGMVEKRNNDVQEAIPQVQTTDTPRLSAGGFYMQFNLWAYL